ncbi:hypothetical protein IFM89_023139 [Coptis chinensis]|uniref:K-box domain-containing protein n=1 Tax=Coptis chinensis TaxID=261450 RepID=A0A835H5U4_9MAGN|nr:hypothetical protein IFM89_023139 [Coptis chinensis]
MENILERYQRYSHTSKDLVATDLESQGSLSFEYNKLKSRLETLQKSQRYFMGEEIATLSFKELQQLEQRLDNALRKIRSRKNKLMFASITDHQRKEKALQEDNNDLKKQIKEMELTLSLSEQHVQNSPSLPPLETLPIPNISWPKICLFKGAEDRKSKQCCATEAEAIMAICVQ